MYTFLHLRLELPLQHGCNTTALCIMHQYTSIYLLGCFYCSTFDLEGKCTYCSQSTRYWTNVAKNAYAEGFREPCQIAKIARGFKRPAISRLRTIRARTWQNPALKMPKFTFLSTQGRMPGAWDGCTNINIIFKLIYIYILQ